MKILISPNYGGGLHDSMLWDTDAELMWAATYQPWIEAVEKGTWEKNESLRSFLIDAFITDFNQRFKRKLERDDWEIKSLLSQDRSLAVVEIPKGALFQVREYDGSEYVEIFDAKHWRKAT